MTTSTHQVRFNDLFNSVMPFLLAFLGMLLITAGAAQAQPEVAANVHFATGYVAATAPGTELRELGKGDDVYSGDRIDTADNGRVQMRFTDGGLVSLMPNTTFSVEEYLHEGKAEEEASLVFGMLKGGLRTVTGTIGKVQHDQYELKTPVATLGIRGTEYVAVLRPANTLRVHVGRGKVVITNDQGSLEVPEGRNAVVTLGRAPEFSEQGPQYQATGPMGDRLVATNQRHQDPHLLNPRANMPELGEQHFIGLPVTTPPSTTPPGGGGSVTPPPGGTSTPPPGGTPTPPPGGTPTPPTPPPVMINLIAAAVPAPFDSVLVLSPADIDASGWAPAFDLGNSGALSWGAYGSGTGTVLGDSVTLGQDVMPYIAGATPAVTVPSGMLNYSLPTGTTMVAYGSSGNTGTLNTFDLGIDLGALVYTFDFNLTMLSDTYSANNSSGSLSSGSTSQDFSFSQFFMSGGTCGAGCDIDVTGFLAGPNAEQAGAAYQIRDQMGTPIISGAAPLTRQP